MIKKLFKHLTNILLATILVTAAVGVISTVYNHNLSFGEYQIVQVMSDSMSVETLHTKGIHKGDVKIIKKSNNYQIHDIIAFHYDDFILYHEIIDIVEDEYVTKGSANKLPEAKHITKNDIIGKQVNDCNLAFLLNPKTEIVAIAIIYIITMTHLILILKSVKTIDDVQPVSDSKEKIRKYKHHGKYLIFILLASTLGAYSMNVYAINPNNLFLSNNINYVAPINWINSDILDNNTYNVSTDFIKAMNKPESLEGKAFNDAWSYKNTIFGNYVGSMDKNISDDFDIMFGYNSGNIIIKKRSEDKYDLYITYEELNTYYGTVAPVYKTSYIKQDDQFYPVQSWVGKCNRNIYSITQLTTYSFDTESFSSF